MNGNPCEFVLAAHRWIVPLRRCSGCEELLLSFSFSLSLCSNNYFLRVSARLSNCVCDWGDVIRRHSPYPFHPPPKKTIKISNGRRGGSENNLLKLLKEFFPGIQPAPRYHPNYAAGFKSRRIYLYSPISQICLMELSNLFTTQHPLFTDPRWWTVPKKKMGGKTPEEWSLFFDGQMRSGAGA